MWKKTEPETAQPDYTPTVTPSQVRERALIGPSIQLKGDICGDEDLLVQGKVEGKIDLRNHNVTIGQQGKVNADIYAKVISVEGEVRGNLFGEEKIIIRKTGQVKGNLVAPRVGLEDGSNFKGSIDMDASSIPKKPATRESQPGVAGVAAAKSQAESSESVSRSSPGVTGGATSSTTK